VIGDYIDGEEDGDNIKIGVVDRRVDRTEKERSVIGTDRGRG
jgi:hypothetical protein